MLLQNKLLSDLSTKANIDFGDPLAIFMIVLHNPRVWCFGINCSFSKKFYWSKQHVQGSALFWNYMQNYNLLFLKFILWISRWTYGKMVVQIFASNFSKMVLHSTQNPQNMKCDIFLKFHIIEKLFFKN